MTFTRRCLGLVFAAWSATAVTAEHTERLYRIGVLNQAWSSNHPAVEGLKAGLRAQQLHEGRQVTFEIRFTEGDPSATALAARALADAGVDVIFTSNEPATKAALSATQRIPIVFTRVGDPVAAGIVATLARPGGNVTGVSSLSTDLVQKRLEILKSIAPSIVRIRAIYYFEDPLSLAAIEKAREVVQRLGVDLIADPVRTAEDVERVLQSVQHGEALLPPPMATLDIPALVLDASLSGRLPNVFDSEIWVRYGALASYGSDYYADGYQAARLVARILRGAHPSHLPVEGANKIELAVNTKTARSLGVTIPRALLFRAHLVAE